MPGVTHIALVGDMTTLAPVALDRLAWFIGYLKQAGFTTIFLVPGHHEYYNSVMKATSEIDDHFRKFCEVHGVIYLNKETYDIPETDLRIAGCTLWSNVRKEQVEQVRKISDYYFIKRACLFRLSNRKP